MLLLLDIEDGTIFEGPAGNVSLAADTLDELRRLQGGPEVGEVVQLDVVPDMGQRGADDGALGDRCGRGDGARGSHFGPGSESIVRGLGVMNDSSDDESLSRCSSCSSLTFSQRDGGRDSDIIAM